MADEPVTQKLLISPVYKRRSFNFIPLKYPIQLKPFYFGLKIKNINNISTSPGILKNLILSPGEGTFINDKFYEELSFNKLNPNEEVVMWWPEPLTTVQKGQTWIACNIIPNESNITFITFQSAPHCTNPIPSEQNNNVWGNAMFITGKIESQQNLTNFLMFLLTLLVFFDGVWGLDVLIKSLLTELGKFFSFISLFLTKLGS